MRETLRIGIISMSTYEAPPRTYGGERYVYGIAKVLDSLGHEIYLFAPPGSWKPPNGKLFYIPHTHGEVSIEAEYFPIQHYLDELLKCDFIIDFSHTKQVSQYLYFYHREFRDRTILVLNGVSSTSPAIPYNIVVPHVSTMECIVQGKSQFADCEICRYFYPDKIRKWPREVFVGVIPWACDSDEFPKEEYLGSEKSIMYMFSGNPAPHKGFLVVANVIKKLYKIGIKELNFVIHLGGSAKIHDEYRKMYKPILEVLTNKLGVKVLGDLPRDEYNNIRKQVMCAVLPRHSYEPFDMCTAEFMMMGIPVITWFMGAPPDIVQWGRYGLVAKSIDDIVNYIINKEWEKYNPEDVRKRAEKFDVRNIAPMYIDLLKKIERKGMNNVFINYWGKLNN